MNSGACVCWCKQVAVGWMSAENTTEEKQQWYFFFAWTDNGTVTESNTQVTWWRK